MSNQVLTAVTQFLIQINGGIVLGLVTVSVLLSLTLLLSFKKVRKLGKQLNRVQQDLKMSHVSVINMGQQLLSLEKKVNQQAFSSSANVNDHTKPLLNKVTKVDSSVSRDSQIYGSQSERSQIGDSKVDNSPLDNGGSIYDKARYYLAKGDDVDSIAQRCNLSHAEVSLLKALIKKPAETF